MNHARRLDWRQWLAATRHPACKDGAIAVALIVLPWVIALVLWLLWLRRHHLDAGTAAAVIFGFVAVSVGLPVAWLAWVPIRNASRSSVPSAGDPAPGPIATLEMAEPIGA
jgi:ABC-type amino acid transport system permease subunit